MDNSPGECIVDTEEGVRKFFFTTASFFHCPCDRLNEFPQAFIRDSYFLVYIEVLYC